MLSLKNLFGKKKDEAPGGAPPPAAGDGKSGVVGAVSKLFDKNEKEVARLRPVVEKINSFATELKALSDDELKARSSALKQRFQDEVTERLSKQKDPESGEPFGWQDLEGELSWSRAYSDARKAIEKEVLDELLPEAFALTREAGDRTIGLRHFDVQMIGGAVLHSGRIAEMRTGEGKTLVATLPVYLNALSGRGVHVITVNDYLAERDANWMRPIYEFLGLTTAFLTNEMDNEQRQPAYRSDVLYATNSEVGFDYLRDNMAHSPDDMVQRPLNFAIVDEVDNILIDEARTPLIISAQVAKTDRALRRQQMAKTCDGVARKLMPAVTDREVENLLDSLTTKGRINVDALMQNILKRGAFTAATEYLVDAYLLSEKSARVDNAGALLDLADELFETGLADADGRAQLESIAMNAARPAGVRLAWQKEATRLVEPFARAYAVAATINFKAESSADALAATLNYELALPDDVAAELANTIAGSDDKPHAIATTVADEMMRRGLIEDGAQELVAAALLAVPVPEAHVETPRRNEEPESALRRQLEKVANSLRDSMLPALVEAAATAPGALQEVEGLLQEVLPEDDALLPVPEVRNLIEALEQISLRGLLPFESTERLWEAVRLGQGRDALRREVLSTIQSHPGDAARKVSDLTRDYGIERESFLKGQAELLRSALTGHEPIAQRAGSGENVDQLRKLLLNDLVKSGGFAEATKAVRAFTTEQGRQHQALAEHLAEEMAQWVEVPREARKQITSLLAEGGRADAVQERILLAVRDLPGENTELPALVGEAVKQLQSWRAGAADELLQKIGAHVALPAESQAAIRAAIEEGEYSAGFDAFIGEQLLTSPAAAPLSVAIEAYGERWASFKAEQSARLLESIQGVLTTTPDAAEALADVLAKPVAGALDAALFGELAADFVSRHLEPLLTEENAAAFADEVKRRLPLAKETQNKLKAANFANRSAEQLQRQLMRLVERSFEVMPFEDFKRVVRNLGWLTEKDEKRRQAALTDMGTLVAEREAGSSAFTDPDNFLDTLLSSEILTDEEAAVVRRAQAEHPNQSLSAVIDRALRLPAERRRRLAETKLQEVQPILDQSIRAHALFQREVNYVIDQGREIVIVDEFTGRKMPGRRYSEGLHEALEAKHGLEVQLESQTVATITIQNYFRLYNKLAGMTGTAKTEESEFAKTYGMEVVSIPTNRTVQRKDYPDIVYKTSEAKFRAITFEILEHHCAGQPVLVGTRSVEVSERMSERLKPQALQALVLAHLIKTKLWDDKSVPDNVRQEILAVARQPIHQLPLMAIKNAAKALGMQSDALHDDNLNMLLSLFTMPNADRNRLATALRVGLPHNVLNAKNHRNEARIIAEAARPGAVTIATNMAGRGVDIVLGGTLDVESRWRVMTMQTLTRYLEGKPLHVRARNQEATTKFVERLAPEHLQSLAWATAVSKAVDGLERQGALEGQGAKEIRDALGQELTTPDLKNRVRSRARRLNLLDRLPLETDPLTDDAPLQLLNAELKHLTGQSFTLEQLRTALQNGVETQATGRDWAETVLLHALSLPLGFSQNASGKLLEALATGPDLDKRLLEAAVRTDAHRAADFDAEALATQVGHVTTEWVHGRLKAFNIHDSAAAMHKLGTLAEHPHEIEINEVQLAEALGDSNMGVQWIRERLRGWNLTRGERSFEATPEQQELLNDSGLVHYRLDQEAAKKLHEAWNQPQQRRAMTQVEVPNLILLGDIAQMVGGNAPFLHPEWLHEVLGQLGIIGEGDVLQAQMMGQTQDEQGNVQAMPVDVLVYRVRLNNVLAALDPTLVEIASKVGREPNAVFEQLKASAPWVERFVDADWVAERLRSLGDLPQQSGASVFIETGVAGQSADIVLESEPRPEDIAHTSEQEAVKGLGGLHIIGSERHESRRIDNQLRGRAGRQGDPGSSRFYVSLEDELWRLFGVRGQWMLNKWDEDEAVEASIISKSIERAQKKVEMNHFESRKHVLQYDDVMNVQREVIYRERRRALMGGDLHDTALDMAQRAAIAEAEKHCPREVRREEWDTQKLYLGLSRMFGATLLGRHLKLDEVEDLQWVAGADDSQDVEFGDQRLTEIVAELYQEREAQLGSDMMRGLERWQVTRSIDEHWMEHLAEMDYLRDAIWQEGYAQKEPIGVYRQEGFALFQKMLDEIRREVTEQIFGIQIEPQRMQQPVYSGPQIMGAQEARPVQTLPMDHGADDGVQLDKDDIGEEDEEPVVVSRPAPAMPTGGLPAPRNMTTNLAPSAPAAARKPTGAKVGRNDPCPCGSGKKYKKCCLPKEQGAAV